MLRRIEADPPRESATTPSAQSLSDEEVAPLPPGHPTWVRDGISVSQRARELLARLRPIAIRVLHFWDHHVRSIVVGGRRVSVDPSGSYRVE